MPELAAPLRAAGITVELSVRGMAERAGAVGGRLAAGRRAEGGWRVHAQLPLAPARS